MNPAQLPRGPWEGSHRTAIAVVPLGQGLHMDKAPRIWDPSCWTASRLGDSRSLPAGGTTGRTGRGESMTATREENAAFDLG